MMTMKFFLTPVVLINFFVDLNGCNDVSDNQRVTIEGIAVLTKSFAAVRTDDSTLFFLEDIRNWELKYLGKRVKVTGILYSKEWHDKERSDDPENTAIPQQRFGVWKILRRPKWKLAK